MAVEHTPQQMSLFTEEEKLSPEVANLLLIFDAYSHSSRLIGDVLRRYEDAVNALGNPKDANLLGSRIKPGKCEVLQAAVNSVAAEAGVGPVKLKFGIIRPMVVKALDARLARHLG